MERLERIKAVVENNKQYSKKEMLLIRNDDVEWLIRQAEKSEPYEKAIKKMLEDSYKKVCK